MNYHVRELLVAMGVVPDCVLEDRLNTIEALCIAADGRLVSRQVIAMVVEQWIRDKE
jgi:hypothetical protein